MDRAGRGIDECGGCGGKDGCIGKDGCSGKDECSGTDGAAFAASRIADSSKLPLVSPRAAPFWSDANAAASAAYAALTLAYAAL